MIKRFLFNISIFLLCTVAEAQENYTRDTLQFQQGITVYEVDFFGLERALNWDTISSISGINKVVLRFHNHTLAPVEIKKLTTEDGVISWKPLNEKLIIPAGTSYDLIAHYNFSPGYFHTNLAIKFKYLRKKYNFSFDTFGYSEQVNGLNSAGNKVGKWIENWDDSRLKRLQYYDDGRLIEHIEYYYYANGNVRLKMDEVNHLHTYYLETGEKDFEMRPDSRTDYYPSGKVRKLEKEKEVSTYRADGTLIRTNKQHLSKVLRDYEMLMESEFYPSGNIKMRRYSNGKQFFYEEHISDCIVKLIDSGNHHHERIYLYENCQIAAIIHSSFDVADGTGRHPYAVSKGNFKEDRLYNGYVEHFDDKSGKLRNITEVKNDRTTEVVWLDGIKYNEKNGNGQKQGLWISNHDSWGIWKQIEGYTDEIIMKCYFENGEQRDTLFHYYRGGNLMEITLKNSDSTIPSNIRYFPSGNVSEKSYSKYTDSYSYVYKTETYPDIPNGEIASMTMYDFYYTYENERIVSRKSPVFAVDHMRSLPHKNQSQYTLSTGEFRNNYLYNGKINYYNNSDQLLRTVRVSGGRINGDRILVFEDRALEKELLLHIALDLDHNGYITTSEARSIEVMDIKGSFVQSASDFKYFTHLKTLRVQGHIVEPTLRRDEEELLKQIRISSKKRPISQGHSRSSGGYRGSYPIIIPEPPEPDPVPIWVKEPEPPQIFDIVEIQPTYPGGTEAMMKFISDNIKYPAIDREADIQGIVYVGFIVNTDGSLEQFKIRKGVSERLDQEAIRVLKAMPNWIPGEQGGKKVRVRFTLPVRFTLY